MCLYFFDGNVPYRNKKRTSCCILVDKEEIGSVGATGMQSRFFENAVAEILDKCGEFSELKLRRAMANSTMISSDVGAAFDPMHADVYDKRSNPFFGKGNGAQQTHRCQRKKVVPMMRMQNTSQN